MESAKPPAVNRKLRLLIVETQKFIEQRQWDKAADRARAAGREAEATGDINGLVMAGTYLERLEDYSAAARLLAAAGLLVAPSALPEWDGSPLSGRTLQVVQRIRDIGSPIRLGRLLPLAARGAGRCVALVEPRLVPLFKRSFPQVDVRQAPGNGVRDLEDADVIASYETLWRHLATDAATVAGQFTPLRADPEKVRRFREKYSRGHPLIGICWSSTNAKKDLPGLADWGGFLRSLNATYVSLQYGDVAQDVAALRSFSGRDVIHDETVDSLTDIDTFSAQVAAMDAVVTISNTGAHLAGALGAPMIVILDDKNHLIWPVQGNHTAWYPSARLVRKEARAWPSVFADVRQQVQQLPGGK